ncbi:M24 family metallopeptidase, partial [Butyricicoccus sp. 1XD8-22]
GLGNHEAPWVAEGSKDVLEENMLISVEPGLYFEGVGGYRHSDTVLITKNGCEFITQFPDDISSMTKTSFNISKIIKGIITQKILKLS